MKKTRTKHNVYAAWDYELELEALNQKSREGWQLVRGGCFYSRFEQDDSVVYRYQMDFNPRIENRMRYVEIFREQGWEYVNSTLNGWHFFRKLYDPALPDSEYEIYSDRPSREQMAGRLSRILLLLSAVTLVLSAVAAVRLIGRPEWARLGILVEMLAAFLLTLTGGLRMRAVGRGVRPKRKSPVALGFALMLAGFVMFVACEEVRPELAFSAGDLATEFEVRLSDYFYLTASSEGEAAIRLTNADGEPVYEISGAPVDVEAVRIPLGRGVYALRVESAQGTQVAVELN